MIVDMSEDSFIEVDGGSFSATVRSGSRRIEADV